MRDQPLYEIQAQAKRKKEIEQQQAIGVAQALQGKRATFEPAIRGLPPELANRASAYGEEAFENTKRQLAEQLNQTQISMQKAPPIARVDQQASIAPVRPAKTLNTADGRGTITQGDVAPPINPNQAVVDRMFDSEGRSITGAAGPSLNKSFEEAQNQSGQRTSLTQSLDREEYGRQLQNIQSGYNNSIADFYGRPRQQAFAEEAGPATSVPAYDRNAFLETMLGSQWRDKVQRLGAKGTEALFTALDKDREAYYAGQRDPLKEAETRSRIELNAAQARASEAAQQQQAEMQGAIELAQADKANTELRKAGLDALEKKQTSLIDSADKFLSGNIAFNRTAFAGLLAQNSPDDALTTVLNQFEGNPNYAEQVTAIKLKKNDIAQQLAKGKIKKEDLGAAYAGILQSLYGMRPVQQ